MILTEAETKKIENKNSGKDHGRRSGVLLHISSLPSPYGIGTLGSAAREFVDFLQAAGQSYWQVLPLCPTSFGDSPYQSFSTFAGNPYLIDLDILCEDGLLAPSDYQGLFWGDDLEQVDFGLLYRQRFGVLRKAVSRLEDRFSYSAEEAAAFAEFCDANQWWLEEYALFMALKDAHDGEPWTHWEEPLRCREACAVENAREQLAEDLTFWKGAQFLFRRQWDRLKAYANERGISMIGDLPIYVALDSVDVWANTREFLLDDHQNPIEVAGCPPDDFARDGQLWGNPLFRWDVMKEDHYGWWSRRIHQAAELFDLVRIDHFRGFDSYYCIPFGAENAVKGCWRKGPGLDFFHEMKQQLGELPIIAEDLGFLTPSVRRLVRSTGFPGMKVLEFAFDSQEDSDYLPHHYKKNCVVYTGTHDNDTLLGWLASLPEEDAAFAREYLRLSEEEGLAWGAIKAVWASVGNLVIVQMQDLLELNGFARMNTPSTLGGSNWRWRMKRGRTTNELAEKLRRITELYRRLPVST